MPASSTSSPAAAPPAGARPAWLVLLASAAIGGLLAYVAVRLLGPALGSVRETKLALRATFGPWLPLVVAGPVLLGMWLVLVAHELGHLLGGWAAGFHFQLLVVGPLRLARDASTDRVTVGLNRSLGLYGGVASAIPRDTHALGRRLALMVAGGPLVSVLCALGAWLALRALPADAMPARMLVGLLGMMSAGIAVVTLVPARTGGFATDGARLLRLARQGPDARREAATLTLVALTGAGTPPREWPTEMLRAAREPADGTVEELFGQLFTYSHLLDASRAAEAGVALDRVMALRGTFPPAFAAGLDLEAAYFAAAHRGDAAGARALLATVPVHAPAVKPYDRARAEAAVLRAEGDAAGARAVARAALAGVPASAPFSRARLEALAAD